MVQLTGFWMALITFASIWCGHVGVRWLEAHISTIGPAVWVMIFSGVILNLFSLHTPDLLLSATTSIVGITLLWDAHEMDRQQHRVQSGRSPANPANPRHAIYLRAGTARVFPASQEGVCPPKMQEKAILRSEEVFEKRP